MASNLCRLVDSVCFVLLHAEQSNSTTMATTTTNQEYNLNHVICALKILDVKQKSVFHLGHRLSYQAHGFLVLEVQSVRLW